MDARHKTALFGLGLAILIFWAVKPKTGGSEKSPGKALDKQKSDAVVALKAYKKALQSGESPESLDKLNGEIAKQYGMKVIRKAGDNSLAVVDMEGNQVIGTRAAA
jgi:hypothetical protein